MKREIKAAVQYLERLVKNRGRVESHKVEQFVARLTDVLQAKFTSHWYPEIPDRGQAYRCIRINMFQTQDPELLQACMESGIPYSDLGLPLEFTLWVDPGEVCCRFGERNPHFSVASFSKDEEQETHITHTMTNGLNTATSNHTDSSPHVANTLTADLCTSKPLNPNAPEWYPQTWHQGKAQVFRNLCIDTGLSASPSWVTGTGT